MPGEIQQITSNVWMIAGGSMADGGNCPEAGNALLYHAGEAVYLLDSGMGEGMRAAIEERLMAIGTTDSFVLLNTSADMARNGNNDIIHNALAGDKQHVMAADLPVNEGHAFAEKLYQLSRYMDPFHTLDGAGLRQSALRGMREVLAAFFGQRKALRWVVALQARRWPMLHRSVNTAVRLPLEQAETLDVGGTAWQGWRVGEHMFALQAGCGLWCYLPVEKFLFAPGWQNAFTPAWPDMPGETAPALLEKLVTMTRTGAVAFLADGSHAEVLSSQEAILQTAEQLRNRRAGLQQALEAVLHREPGMTVRALHRRLRKLRHRPAVAWYMDEPLPAGMAGFEQFLAGLLLEMGCEAKGVWRRKKFFLNE